MAMKPSFIRFQPLLHHLLALVDQLSVSLGMVCSVRKFELLLAVVSGIKNTCYQTNHYTTGVSVRILVSGKTENIDGVHKMGSLQDIDSLEELLKVKNEQLRMKEKEVRENGKDIEIKAQESELQKKEEMLNQMKKSLKSVKNGYFVWSRASKVRECENKIKEIKDDIKNYKQLIEELKFPEKECENLRKSNAEMETNLERLKREEKQAATEPWRYIKDQDSTYCEQIKDYFLHRFKTLDLSVSFSRWRNGPSSRFVNIVLVGSTGSGKSSFINTCTTALHNSGDMIHASVDQGTTLPSATMRLNLAPLRLSNGKQLPIRLFDCRGIHNEIGHKVMEKIIRGHLEPNTEISVVPEMEANSGYNLEPGLNNEMHCIVYVVRADKLGTQSMQFDEGVKEIREICKLITKDNIPQCVLVTNIDRIVPRKNIRRLFHYHIALRYCRRASNALNIPLKYIYPMSNYDDEGIPTAEKDALALDILWKMTHLGLNRLQLHKNRGDILEGFYE